MDFVKRSEFVTDPAPIKEDEMKEICTLTKITEIREIEKQSKKFPDCFDFTQKNKFKLLRSIPQLCDTVEELLKICLACEEWITELVDACPPTETDWVNIRTVRDRIRSVIEETEARDGLRLPL